jgi:hypothetical protein
MLRAQDAAGGSEETAQSLAVRFQNDCPSILRSALQYDFFVKNPLDGLRLPPDKRGRRSKPVISPEQFDTLLQFVTELRHDALHCGLPARTKVWTSTLPRVLRPTYPRSYLSARASKCRPTIPGPEDLPPEVAANSWCPEKRSNSQP